MMWNTSPCKLAKHFNFRITNFILHVFNLWYMYSYRIPFLPKKKQLPGRCKLFLTVGVHCLIQSPKTFSSDSHLKAFKNTRAHLGAFFSFNCSMYFVKFYLYMKGETCTSLCSLCVTSKINAKLHWVFPVIITDIVYLV